MGIGLLGNGLSIPFQILAFLVVARTLGAGDYGVYVFAAEFGFVFSMFAEASLGILVNREIARRPDRDRVIYGNLLILKLLITVFSYLVMMLSAWLIIQDPRKVMAILILGGGNFVFAFMQFLFGLFRAYERMEFEAGLALLQPAVYLLLVYVTRPLIGPWDGVLVFGTCFLTSYVLAVGLGYIWSRHLVRPEWKPDPALLKYLIRETTPLLTALVLMGLYSRLGVLMLEAFSTPDEVGLFGAAFRLSFTIVMVPMVISGAWLAGLSRAAVLEPEAFSPRAQQLHRATLMIGLPVTVMLIILAEPIVLLLFGPPFKGSIQSFQVLMISTLLFFVCYTGKTILESMGRQSLWTAALVIGVLVCFGADLYLVPHWSSTGAAAGMAAATLAMMIMTILFTARAITWRPVIMTLARLSLASAAMALTIILIKPLSWIAAGLAGSVVFGLLLLILQEVKIIDALILWREFRSRMG